MIIYVCSLYGFVLNCRKLSRSDLSQSLSDNIHGLNVFLPKDQNLFTIAKDNYGDLKEVSPSYMYIVSITFIFSPVSVLPIK